MNYYTIIDPRPDVINLALKTIFKQLYLRLDVRDVRLYLINLLVNLIDLFVNLIDLSFDFINLGLESCLDIVKLSINFFNPLFNLYYPYSLGSIIII